MKPSLICCGSQPWAEETAHRLQAHSPLFFVQYARDPWKVEHRQDLADFRYLFFLHWSAKVPEVITDHHEAVNMHCAELPFGRGGNPIENLRLRGFTHTVMTAHRMTQEIDAGPIYGQRGPISLAGTKDEILQRFIEPCAELIEWIVKEEPTPTPQVGEVVTFRRLSPEQYVEVWK